MILHTGKANAGAWDDHDMALGFTHRPLNSMSKPSYPLTRDERVRLDGQRAKDLSRYRRSLKYDAAVEREYQREIKRAKQARVARRPNQPTTNTRSIHS